MQISSDYWQSFQMVICVMLATGFSEPSRMLHTLPLHLALRQIKPIAIETFGNDVIKFDFLEKGKTKRF